MAGRVLFSSDFTPIEWSDIELFRLEFGPKAAGLAALPRSWTPQFALVSASSLSTGTAHDRAMIDVDAITIARIKDLGGSTGQLYVRSSVVGETIWDRGSFDSVIINSNSANFGGELFLAAGKVLNSAPRREVGLVIQRYVEPLLRGEFGNLLRISKTRDQWELSFESAGSYYRERLNTQRDEAANPHTPLSNRPNIPRERLFGSIAAWLNNYLLRGRSQRLTCECVADHQNVYLVQIDEESEDFLGVNPYQIRIAPAHQPRKAQGTLLSSAEGETLGVWDKLSVLNELWEPSAPHKPTLFFVPLLDLPESNDPAKLVQLSDDFSTLIGPDKIVVRTSVRSGTEKLLNLPKKEGLTPLEAAEWCLRTRDRYVEQQVSIADLAFVAHRFIAARSSAWVRAEPGNPIVEVHSLWGLPDALQYCAYDIWEIHVPTETATEYPEYKSHMLIARDDGKWEYVRVKNEFGRNLSIGRREAMDLAIRTKAISDRLNRPCHVMWFVNCFGEDGIHFNIPWYWTPAHDAERNLDRSNYRLFRVQAREDLAAFEQVSDSKAKYALELMPKEPDLIRDMTFIDAVGGVAKTFGVPVIISGSTLAHAYFALRRQGCAVIARGEKEHSRIRRSTNFGKLVRDKIPQRISTRKELEITRKIPTRLKVRFLASKLLEEALEFRNATSATDKRTELADIYEVVRALAQTEGLTLDDIAATANEKRAKAGGFDEGLILLKTGVLGRNREMPKDVEKQITQVLARRVNGSTYELPFTFFGFMELDKARSLYFDDIGVRLDVSLKIDRIELNVSKINEQLELELDVSLGEFENNNNN